MRIFGLHAEGREFVVSELVLEISNAIAQGFLLEKYGGQGGPIYKKFMSSDGIWLNDDPVYSEKEPPEENDYSWDIDSIFRTHDDDKWLLQQVCLAVRDPDCVVWW